MQVSNVRIGRVESGYLWGVENTVVLELFGFFFYTKWTVTMKMKSKFFKKLASCSLESNKIKMIKATPTVIS